MTSARVRSPLLATVASLFLFFILAYAFDSLAHSIPKTVDESVNPLKVEAFVSFATPFFIVMMTLAVAWVHLVRLPAHRTSAVVVLVTGILLISAALPFFSTQWLRSTPIGGLPSAVGIFGIHALYYMEVSFVVVGAVALFRRSPGPTPGSG